MQRKDNMEDKKIKWQIRSVRESTRDRIVAYAKKNDLTLAKALEIASKKL